MSWEGIQSLLSRVPGPPEGYSMLPARLELIEDFEKRFAMQLPNEMRDWLRVLNGAPIGPGGLFGIGTGRRNLEIEAYLTGYPLWAEKGWVPIAGDGTGNYYVIATKSEGPSNPVCFIDTEEDSNVAAYAVASDLQHFLYFLLARELGDSSWPFSREEVLAVDPALERQAEAPLPWES